MSVTIQPGTNLAADWSFSEIDPAFSTGIEAVNREPSHSAS